ncbi:MAG: hypothetical protein LBL15_06210 [Oscillospiraceae bacterium]|jgi:hypothetical protein|nr:hypothetical protein [Oscillospiraceae bacterium]
MWRGREGLSLKSVRPARLYYVLAYAGLGGAVTSARCGYAFAANNAERLVGMVLMFVAVAVICFLGALHISGAAVTHILPVLLPCGRARSRARPQSAHPAASRPGAASSVTTAGPAWI